MSFDPHVWAWPQWTAAILMFLALSIEAAMHGKPKADKDGKPLNYSFFTAFCRALMWGFILVCGGFFGGRP